jgi:hypothetical protein
VVLTYLPHPLWRWIDAAFNRFTGKPHRILVKYYKGGDHRSDR